METKLHTKLKKLLQQMQRSTHSGPMAVYLMRRFLSLRSHHQSGTLEEDVGDALWVFGIQEGRPRCLGSRRSEWDVRRTMIWTWDVAGGACL